MSRTPDQSVLRAIGGSITAPRLSLAPLALAGVALSLSASIVNGQVSTLGPTPYSSFADSPFNGVGFTWFALLTAEPGSASREGISINTTGGGPAQITGPGGITDSVDADDGTIDGNGSNGRSYFTCPSAIPFFVKQRAFP